MGLMSENEKSLNENQVVKRERPYCYPKQKPSKNNLTSSKN